MHNTQSFQIDPTTTAADQIVRSFNADRFRLDAMIADGIEKLASDDLIALIALISFDAEITKVSIYNPDHIWNWDAGNFFMLNTSAKLELRKRDRDLVSKAYDAERDAIKLAAATGWTKEQLYASIDELKAARLAAEDDAARLAGLSAEDRELGELVLALVA